MKKKNIYFYFLALIWGFITLGGAYVGIFSGIEHFLEDLLVSEKKINSDIVIIAIDNESISKIGQWPWPREVFAKAIINLEAYSPKAVGFDVMFSEPSRAGDGDDKKFAEAMRRVKYPLVMPIEFTEIKLDGRRAYADQKTPVIKGIPLFESERQVSSGHVNLILDRDGIVRKVPLWIGFDNSNIIYKSLGFKVAEEAGLPAKTLYTPLSVERIVFAGPPGSIPKIPFWKLAEGQKDLPLQNKIVFIGSTAADLHDDKPTPFSKGTAMSGVEIHAGIANMSLENYRLTSIDGWYLLFWILIASLIPALFFARSERPWKAVSINIAIGILYNVLIVYLFETGIVVNIVQINLAWIGSTIITFAYHYLTVEKEKTYMRMVFSKYVSKDVLEEMMRDPSKVELGGEEKETTIFFSDVRGFTTLSEGLTPTQLTQFLNKYLTVMTDIVLENRGVVDKYIGDAVMAFWGAPLANPTHAVNAVVTAQKMITALKEFNKKSAEEGDPVIDIGIGLNSGKVTAGNMGSNKRFDYTVMGDAVNLASRLEGQTKTYGVHIIMSEHTLAHLPSEMLESGAILVRELDKVKVKGKKLPVTIFEVVEKEKEESVKNILPKFDEARRSYYAGDWQRVVILCEEILAVLNDGPTRLLYERAVHFIEHPPVSWEGIYELKTK